MSKGWIANLNALRRKSGFSHEMLDKLLPTLQELDVSTLLISGDFTTSSTKSEFKLASEYLQTLCDAGIKIYLVPGNHDAYTKQAHRECRFYRCFAPYTCFCETPPFDLEKDHVAAYQLSDRWYLAAFDAAIPSWLMESTGDFHKKVEENLYSLLSSIPKTSHVIVMGHFPYHYEKNHRHRLKNKNALEDLLNGFDNVRVYLHGHAHNQTQIQTDHHLILDSGSIAETGKSYFNLLDLNPDSFTVDTYHYRDQAFRRLDDKKLVQDLV